MKKVLEFAENESLIIGENITVTVLDVQDETVRLKIEGLDAQHPLVDSSREALVGAAVEVRVPR